MADTEENKDKSEISLREERILEFWREKNIFAKSLEQTKGKKEFVFYEGPPTANGKPGIHHLEARAFKDAIPRYKTMQGFHVRRKAGWDTHGLPVELQVEKKLGLNSKKAIEEYGIAKFNQECKESVWEYTDLWERFTDRIGFWLDRENAYVTYHNDYIESVWNVIKQADKQNLLYKDYKVVPWCPRCGTALSSHELAQGYETVKDLSVYAKFKVTSPVQNFPRLRPQAGPSATENSEQFTYILAWTTTPWTLPGNLALAVGEDIDYVKVKVGEEFFILAKERLSIVENYEIVAEVKGRDLVGLEYEPLYPFLKDQNPAGIEKAFKVYTADFVTTEDGTGVVHTAVMYGQDDFVLGSKVGLPKFHLVNPEGKFISGTGFLENRFVRDEETAVEIIKDLAHRGLLFKKEKYEHTYPFCWRCKTGLIYYARDSWYIRMSDPKVKNKLISENQKINWEPSHIRDGRFGEWLRDLKDWAISRERYWGTPLPVWVTGQAPNEERLVIGSVEELKKYSRKSGNKYFVMRHGEAENNVQDIYSSDPNTYHITEKGKEQALQTAKTLKNKKITKIYCSPLLRTRETADILAEVLDFPKDKIIYDANISELNFGNLSGKNKTEYWQLVKNPGWNFSSKIPGGESLQDAKNRFGAFLYELEKKHNNESILIISHGIAVEVFPTIAAGMNQKESMLHYHDQATLTPPGGVHEEKLFVSSPHNENFELDFHRPYIDEVVLEKDGKKFYRTKEVMDVWLDSGAMPFAQDHYPFDPEPKRTWYGAKVQKLLYPADFISEAIDQTRGWFYTLHAVGALMGKGLAFKNVICLGHLLDAKGKKMSKSLGNIVDPWEMIPKYGADTLRLWMYSVNQPGESKNFDEKTVLELQRQVFGLLYNVLAFYELYRDTSLEKNTCPKSENVLDVWILERLDEVAELTTKNLDNYKLLEPVRAMKEFIGDLSTWYLRRSRERIKDGDADAKQTLYFVLKNLAKLLAPFAPFAAEDIWQRLKNVDDAESVHLAEWPEAGKVHSDILENMQIVRGVVSRGLEARQKAGIQVRQPLASLMIDKKLGEEYLELVKEELNVKEVVIGGEFRLTTEITAELRMEGEYRELMRQIQDMRKEQGLKPGDKLALPVETIYKKYKIYPRLQMHMLRVAAVASLICDNFTEPINKEEIVLTALFHDMGNIIKAKNINFFNDFTEDETRYWEGVKKEYVEKYGADEMQATLQILRELGFPERMISMVDQNRFSFLCNHRDGDDMEIKIAHYSDGRVPPSGVTSYTERMSEARVRYKDHPDFDPVNVEKMFQCGLDIERQIFAKCKIKPEDITEESVAPIIEELKTLMIK